MVHVSHVHCVPHLSTITGDSMARKANGEAHNLGHWETAQIAQALHELADRLTADGEIGADHTHTLATVFSQADLMTLVTTNVIA